MRRITILLILNVLFPVFTPANGTEAPAQGDNPASMLNVQGGCNTFGGGYRINARGQLETGQMRSTMIACEPALMQADAAPAIYILDLIVETETVPQ